VSIPIFKLLLPYWYLKFDVASVPFWTPSQIPSNPINIMGSWRCTLPYLSPQKESFDSLYTSMNALCFFVSVIRYSGSLRKAIDENDWANVVLLTTRSARGVQGLFVVYNVYASWLSYSSVHTPVDLVLLDLCRPVQIASHFLFVSLNQDLRCPTSRSCSVSSPTN